MSAIIFDGRDFRPIPGSEGYYVSSLGEVLSTRMYRGTSHSIMALNVTGSGYLSAIMNGSRVYAHRALAMAWIPNPDGLPEVNHIDGNKANNILSNLEWVSSSDNKRHAHRTGLNGGRGNAIVGVNTTTGHRVRFKSGRSAVASGFSRQCIRKCLRGERDSHNGYVWSLA